MIRIESVSIAWRIIDYLMSPIMWMLCGFVLELPQESHLWHIQKFKTKQIDLKKCVVAKSDLETIFRTRGFKKLAIFHMQLFGGWNKYIILQNPNFNGHWNVGWHVVDKKTGKLEVNEIQKLKIYSDKIKLLKGHKDTVVYFLGINPDGSQIKPKIIDEGIIGDGKWKNVRLF